MEKTHNYTFTLQKYMLLQEQHEQLSSNLEQIRPRKSSTSSGSTVSSPATSPSRGWEDRSQEALDTIVDEDTIFKISAEEQRLFDINESIKRALTELLNCDAVRDDIKTRMWAQTRLMETEKELRSGRRRRSSPGME
ncbi:hypothetical protein ESCO_003420 [Escovopsis weberi]|uniref:Uncharacterized protein n=1 Tax=Escovopsis weberi TaxID=150374 RepID=A0A0M9VXB1_ESCWE|nr:hypothetical protein ESCO_003420 [Escovopsis weberi]